MYSSFFQHFYLEFSPHNLSNDAVFRDLSYQLSYENNIHPMHSLYENRIDFYDNFRAKFKVILNLIFQNFYSFDDI